MAEWNKLRHDLSGFCIPQSDAIAAARQDMTIGREGERHGIIRFALEGENLFSFLQIPET